MNQRYVVITPARDEERTIELTVRSMLAQTIAPLRWVVVDDGSTDRTRELLERHRSAAPWIDVVPRRNRGFRALGGGVVDAFNEGFERVRPLPWEFVVKLDADLSFEPRYFENLLRRFDADPKLGMASGKTFLVNDGVRQIEWCPDEHVRGPAKMYRRACFEAIGGLEARRGWDMIDETRAQMLGWTTRSFIDEPLIHHRPIDGRQANVLKSRFEMGELYHFLGYHWLYLLVRSARSALQDYPRVTGGTALLLGYLRAALRGAPRYDADYVAWVRKQQLSRFTLRHLRGYLEATSRREAA
ncbi:MAG: glycosyltransferase family 2 protein [Proteobacteria bacterium]|nr:MAG: glycosyltransferase family 2 protein [Pseudomonadota bacterium]